MSEFNIPKSMHDEVMGSFWFMLRELEEQAYSSGSFLSKNMVESLYHQWNKVTGSSLKPRWVK